MTHIETAMDAAAGLLLCAHGSSNPRWRQAIDALRDDVSRDPRVARAFGRRVRVAFLEATAPALADGVQALRAAGARRVVAVPIFLTESSHLRDDVPVALGVRDDAAIREALRAEGIASLPYPSPVVLTGPVGGGDALVRNAARRLEGYGGDRGQCGVFFVYYGSPAHPAPWRALCARIGDALVEREGWRDHASAPVGHWVPGGVGALTEALRAALEAWPRLALLPLLVSVGHYQTTMIPEAVAGLAPEERARVVTLRDAILPCPEVASWVVDEALRAVEAAAR